MIMADVLKIFLLILGTQLVFLSYWLAAEALFPNLVRRSQDLYTTSPLRSILFGTLAAAPPTLVGIALLSAGSAPAKAVGFLLIAATVTLGFLGSAGLCRRIGAGLRSPVDQAQPWRRTLRGAAVLAFVLLAPFLGWFVVLPLVLLSGVGTALNAAWILRRKRRLARRAPEAA